MLKSITHNSNNMGSQFSNMNEKITIGDGTLNFRKPSSFAFLSLYLRANNKEVWRDHCFPFHWQGRGHFTYGDSRFRIEWKSIPFICALTSVRISLDSAPNVVLWEFVGNADGKVSSGFTEEGNKFTANLNVTSPSS